MLSLFEEGDTDDSPASLFSILPNKKEPQKKENKAANSKYPDCTLITQQIFLSQLDVQSGKYVPISHVNLVVNRESDVIKFLFSDKQAKQLFSFSVSENIDWNYQSNDCVILTNLGITWHLRFRSAQDAKILTIIALSAKVDRNNFICIKNSNLPHTGSEILSYDSYELKGPITGPIASVQENTVDETKFSLIQNIVADQSEYIYKNDTIYSYITVLKSTNNTKDRTPLANPPEAENQINSAQTAENVSTTQEQPNTLISETPEEEETEIEEIIDDGKSSIIALRNEVEKRLEELQMLLKSNMQNIIDIQPQSEIIKSDKLQEATDMELARSADLDRRLADVTRRLQAAERHVDTGSRLDEAAQLWAAREELAAEGARLADVENDCAFFNRKLEELQRRVDGAEAAVQSKMTTIREEADAAVARESAAAREAIAASESALNNLKREAGELRARVDSERAEAANLRRGGDSPEVRAAKEAISARIAAVVRAMADDVAALVEDNFEEGRGYGGRIVVSALRTALETAAEDATGDGEEESYEED